MRGRSDRSIYKNFIAKRGQDCTKYDKIVPFLRKRIGQETRERERKREREGVREGESAREREREKRGPNSASLNLYPASPLLYLHSINSVMSLSPLCYGRVSVRFSVRNVTVNSQRVEFQT